MIWVKRLGLGVVGLTAVVALAAGGGYLWAKSTAAQILTAPHEAHRADFPIPFPLTDAEIAELRAERLAASATPASDVVDPVTGQPAAPVDPLAGVDLDAIATERAIARGKHLTESLYPCTECHGADFSGGNMIDDPMVGVFKGANLTTGKGSRTASYTAADWDRTVRHGILPDGRATLMPAKDFFAMSDRELSDIVSYIRSLPPVDVEQPPVTLGPLMTVLVATHQVEPSAEALPDHQKSHRAEPPPAAVNAEFGGHIAQVCTGCHTQQFTGGPIVGAPPDWPPAANLTPVGLKGWTFADFKGALREGKSKDGRMLRAPMDALPRMMAGATDEEIEAIWVFLQTLPSDAPTQEI